MSIKIKAYRLENFKRVREISIEPEDCGLFVIGGNNREGKTSSLDGIPWLLGGAKFAPSNPKNTNAIGNIFGSITLSNGIVVERGGKNGSLKVTDPSGAKAGQELLNEFVSSLALDLPKFLHASDKEKAMILLDTLGIRDCLDELEQKEKILYDERTEIGRVALSMRKHADEMPFYHDAPGAEISAATIIEKQRAAVDSNSRNDAVRSQRDQLVSRVESFSKQLADFDADVKRADQDYHKENQDRTARAEERIKSNEERILSLEAEIKRLKEENGHIATDAHDQYLKSKTAWEDRATEFAKKRDSAVKTIADTKLALDDATKAVTQLPGNTDLGIFERDIEKLESENAKFRANASHDKAAAEATEKESEYDSFTQKVEDVRRDRMNLLASVKMPLSGLTVKDSLLFYNGQRWDCMSGSEQLIVAASIVRAVKPECGFVLMDQLESMDVDTLDEFNRWLKQEDLQVIATRVSSGSECAIIIEDGMLKQ